MSRQVSYAQRPADPRPASDPGSRVGVAELTPAPQRATPLPLGPALRTQQAAELSRRLAPHITGTLRLTVTDNRAVIITVQRDSKRRLFTVRLHHLFLDTPPEVLRTLARYILLGDRQSSRQLNLFIDGQQDLIRDEDPDPQTMPIRTRGKVFDLQQLFDQINARYFDGAVTARVSWGRQVKPGRYRHSINVGYYVVELNLIRIHPGLDRSWIPRFYLEWVLFHEMLHAVHPILTTNGRRRFHTTEFARDELRFEQHALAVEWERRNLAALLSI